MTRVVVDTNVVVSGVLRDEGLPASILDLASNKKILMIVSASILAEYEEVLRRPHFKIAPARVNQILFIIRTTSILVKPTVTLAISRDESDNRFYECATTGKADYLVTGNIKHFPLSYKSTKVVTPREFIELVGAKLFRE